MLRIARPLLIVTFSNLSATAIAEDWPWADDEDDMHASVVHRDRQAWAERSIKFKQMNRTMYVERLGSITLCIPNTDPNHALLHVSIQRPGAIAYDPVLQQLTCTEMFLGLIAAKEIESAVTSASARTSNLPDWLRTRQEDALSHLKATGVRDALVEATHKRQVKRHAVGRLRTLARYAHWQGKRTMSAPSRK